MKKEIFSRLAPLWDVVSAVEQLIEENATLKSENKDLKERVEWFENAFNESVQRSGKAVGDFVKACLDGRITINENNETIIKSE